MIQFKCHCGHPFEVSDDEAGGLIQCTSCGRLNDVPTLDDLPHLAEDGTYDLEETAPPPVLRSDKRDWIHHSSQTRDMRASIDEVLAVGVRPQDMQKRAPSPKYDPFDGKLIRPIDVRPDPADDRPPEHEIPIAKPALSYARGQHQRVPSLLGVYVRLFSAANMLVIGIILLMFAVCNVMLSIPLMNILFGLLIFPPLFVIGVAHFANICDETGPQDRDELPVPMRQMSLADDIWNPFLQMVLAGLYCFAPMILLAMFAPKFGWQMALGCLIIATLLFPAVYITTTTSGSILNLAPHRVLGVILQCGFGYVIALGGLVVGWVIFFVGMVMTLNSSTRLGDALMDNLPGAGPGNSLLDMPRWVENYFCWPVLFIGLCLLHAFGWVCGLLYRKHHEKFPWVLQRHISTRTDVTKQLEESRGARIARRTRPVTAQPRPGEPQGDQTQAMLLRPDVQRS